MSATIAIVGDIYLEEDLTDSAVYPLLRSADLTFANLEGPVSERGVPAEKWINMRMHPDLLPVIRRAGFDVVTVANNHMMDYGPDAFHDTLRLLPECDLTPVGGGANLQAAWQPVIKTANGVRVAFLGAASTLPPGSAAGEDRPGIAPIHIVESYRVDPFVSSEQPGTVPYVHTTAWAEDVERAQAAVVAARAQADFVIVALHWGVPPLWQSNYQGDLAEYQRPVGQALINAGADVIVGHHPHSLQGVEVCNGKPIFHSVGNFIFHKKKMAAALKKSSIARNSPYSAGAPHDSRWAESVIINVTISTDAAPVYTLTPVLLDPDGNPQLLTGGDAAHVIERLAAMSARLGGKLEFREDQGHLTS